MNYLIIGLVFVLLLMLYAGYLYATSTVLIKKAVYLPETAKDNLDTIAWDKLGNPASTTYHYEGWLYLKDKPSATSPNIPVIFYRGDDGIGSNTQVILGMDGSSLGLYTNAKIDKGHMTSAGSLVLTILSDFPVQKWTHFIVNIVNGSIIECYINGKLVKSMQAPPAPANGKKLIDLTPDTRSNLKIGGVNSIKGYITKFKRDPVVLNAEEAWNTYLEGNGLESYAKWFGGYGAAFSLFSSAGEIKKVTIL